MRSKLYNLPEYKCKNAHPVLLRVIVNEKYTRIDFGYQTTDHYFRGGWVDIDPNTYLQMGANKPKLKMTHADNIPVGPDKHYFERTTDRKYFSLFFEPILKGIAKFDLIERLPVSKTLFNFYNVKLAPELAIELLEE
jgi:hypothetical protein